MNIQWLRIGASASLAAFLAACASSGNSTQWQNIGSTSNGNIKISVDKSSIRKNGVLVSFKDRKVVSKPAQERFTDTPAYKTALGEWEIHCANKTYRLVSLQLLNERGQNIFNQRYSAVDIRPMSVMSNGVAQKQYELVCSRKF